MSAMASQIIGTSIVYSTVCLCADERKHQSSAPLAFMRGIHRWPVKSPHKEPVTRKMFPFDDAIAVSPIRYQLTDTCMNALKPNRVNITEPTPSCPWNVCDIIVNVCISWIFTWSLVWENTLVLLFRDFIASDLFNEQKWMIKDKV